VAGEAAAEDFEEGFEVALGVGAIYDGEGAGFEGGGEFAVVVAEGSVSFDDDDWGGGGEAGEEIEEAWAGLFALAWVAIQREGEVNDSDVDWTGVDDFLGGVCGVGDVGLDAHWLEHSWEAVYPRVWLPAGARKEEIEAASRGSGWGALGG